MARGDFVRVDFTDAIRGIEATARAAGEEAVSGLRVIGEVIITDVRVSRPGAGVPKDEGALAASLRATGPDARNIVKLSAGGASAPYALAQHERLDYHHDTGEARYLVRGVERAARGESGEAQRVMKQITDRAIAKAARGRRKR